jgi:hypothetical protein
MAFPIWPGARLIALLVAIWAGSACSEDRCMDGGTGKCGLVNNEVSVLFKDGTTREQVDAINAEIGATVVAAPELTALYRIRLPSGWCYQRGVTFYQGKPEVQAASVAVNLCPDQLARDQ